MTDFDEPTSNMLVAELREELVSGTPVLPGFEPVGTGDRYVQLLWQRSVVAV